MTLRLSDDETEAVRTAAEREGISMQELIRKAVRRYTDDWTQERDAFLGTFARDNKPLLDRLGQ